MNRKFLVIFLIIILSVALLAACNKDTFTVTFSVDGQVYANVSVVKGGKATFPKAPNKSGYTFDNWYLDDGVWTQPFTASTSVISNLTVYAHWVENVVQGTNTFVVTFDSNGGSSVPALRVKEGDSFTMPTPPTKQDFNFGGWFLDTAYVTEFTTSTKITRNFTVYAKWTPADSSTYFVREGTTLKSLTDLGKKAANIVLPTKLDGITIAAIGDELFKNNTNVKSITFPANSGYKSIGANAFSGCTNLDTVKLINGIETIGEGAFSGCTKLENVQLPTSLKAVPKEMFKGCTALRYFQIYDQVTSIGDGALYGCSSVMAVRVLPSVQSIGNDAFYGCGKLSSVVIDSGVKTIGDRAFYNCISLGSISLPETVTAIGQYCFYNCESLKNANLSSGITEIKDYTFYNAKNMESLTFGAEVAVNKVGASAFAYCAKLPNLTLPDTCTAIGANAFNGCKKFTSFTIPVGVTVIEQQTFLNCILLETVTFHQNVTEVKTSAFTNCGELKSVVGATGLTNIGSGAFRSCRKLTSFAVPSGVKTIGTKVFEDCVALANVTIAEGVTLIDTEAFSGAVALTTIDLPSSLEQIRGYAFNGCVELTEVTIPAGVSVLSATAFENCTKLTAINVDSQNSYFEADGAILFTKGKKDLIFYSDALTATSYTVPEGVVTLNDRLFVNNVNLTSVVLPSTLEDIGANVFYGCTALATINFPSCLKNIGTYAFRDTAITQAILPMGIVNIEQYAFRDCKKLTKAVLPATLVGVGKNVFYGCRGAVIDVDIDQEELSGWSSSWDVSGEINGITINYGGTRVVSGDYQYIVRNDKAVLTDYFGSATEVIVPSTIDGYAVIGLLKTFKGDSAITSVVVPNSIEVITELTFKGLTELTSLTLPFAGAYRGADGIGGLFGYVFDYSESSQVGFTPQVAEGGSLSRYYTEVPKKLTTVT
ncbi:MAG: leucine-rich repeat protein, partial [Clostridia bacterium]|nr:leucine-rich repeat protein [Clostridia bacterium]